MSARKSSERDAPAVKRDENVVLLWPAFLPREQLAVLDGLGARVI